MMTELEDEAKAISKKIFDLRIELDLVETRQEQWIAKIKEGIKNEHKV